MQNRRERRKLTFRYEGKFFIIGTLIGCLFGITWQDFIQHYHIFKNPLSCIDVGVVKKEANHMLLSYIDGKWSSSIGDLIIRINNSDDKKFMVMEIFKSENVERTYKITKITDINGILGIVKLNICETNNNCELDSDREIPIQINKVFGKDKTITISYDSRLTYCIDSDDQCTRAFKRLEY